MITTCTVPSCSNATDGGTVCLSCLGGLWADLLEVVELVDDLDDSVARLTNTGPRVGSRPAEVGLPFNAGAAEIRDDLHNVLVTWVRDLWETHALRRPAPTGETWPDGSAITVGELDPLAIEDTVPDMVAWLRRHPTWIEWHPAGGELVDEIGDAAERVRRAVDLPPARLFCGPCPDCSADMYARPERTVVACRECGTRHDAAALRDKLLVAVRKVEATAAEVARALPKLLGRELSPNTLRTWARAGKLAKGAPDGRGRPRYRVGDVIDLALATPVRVRTPAPG